MHSFCEKSGSRRLRAIDSARAMHLGDSRQRCDRRVSRAAERSRQPAQPYTAQQGLAVEHDAEDAPVGLLLRILREAQLRLVVTDRTRVILSCGGGMPQGVPTENVAAFLDAARPPASSFVLHRHRRAQRKPTQAMNAFRAYRRSGPPAIQSDSPRFAGATGWQLADGNVSSPMCDTEQHILRLSTSANEQLKRSMDYRPRTRGTPISHHDQDERILGCRTLRHNRVMDVR